MNDRRAFIMGFSGVQLPVRQGWRIRMPVLLALGFCLAMLLCGQAVESGSVEGQLMVNGEATALNYVYACQKPGFFDKSQLDSIVILSSMELPANALSDQFERLRLQRESGLVCLELTIDSGQNLISVSLRHSGFRVNPSGNSTHYVLEVDRFDDQVVAGNVYCTKEQEFAGATFRFDAKFHVSYYHEEKAPPPTAAEMETAAASPQAAVYRAYENAVQEGDLAGLKKLVTAEVAAMMSEDDAAEMMDMMKAFLPTEVNFLRLAVDGDSAELSLQGVLEGESVKGSGRFVRQKGEWRLEKVSWE